MDTSKFERYDENKLRKLFESIYDSEDSLALEKEFAKKALDMGAVIKDGKNDGSYSSFSDEDSQAVAQYLTSSGKYIKLWGLSKDLFIDLCKSGLLDIIGGISGATIGMFVSAFDLVRRWGDYCIPLENGEKEFCKYLLINSYTVKDWFMNSGKRGFLLDDAIELYCCSRINAGYPTEKKEQLMQETRAYADKFIKVKIMKPAAEKGRYTINY